MNKQTPCAWFLSVCFLLSLSSTFSVGADLTLSTDELHNAIHTSHSHPHLQTGRQKVAWYESKSSHRHTIRLQAGSLHLSSAAVESSMPTISQVHLQSNNRGRSLKIQSLHNDHASPVLPHRVFSQAFFRGADSSRLPHEAHTQSLPFESQDQQQQLNLHIPNLDTLNTMKQYFSQATDNVAAAFAAHYVSSESPSLPSIDSVAHPLHSHPNFHYQWLVYFKAPLTKQAVADLESRITPYKFRHFLPYNAFLISLPYEKAWQLQRGMEGHRGALVFIGMYDPSLKLQPNLFESMQSQLEKKLAGDARGFSQSVARKELWKSNPFQAAKTFPAHHISPQAGRTHAHELRLTFTMPTFGVSEDVVAVAQNYFPSNRADTKLMQEYALKQMKYWNNNPMFLELFPSDKHVSLGIEFTSIDSHQLLVKLPAETLVTANNVTAFLDHFITKLSEHPLLQWVEVSSTFTVSNKHAKYVVQADLEGAAHCTDTPGNAQIVGIVDPHTAYQQSHDSSTGLFEAPFYSLLNLKGQDQLLTIGDTGVDYDSCFFYDAEHPTVAVNPSQVDPNHRKIGAYVTSPTGESRSSPRAQPGDEEGHGTHTAASLAGGVVPDAFPTGHTVDDFTRSALSQYDGIASAARLVIFDFQNPGDQSLYVPNDVYHDYLLESYNFGSRVGSNSWGDDSGVYDSYTRDVDSFLYDHMDYVMIIAAGNLGGRGLHTIATPAIAKNLITVGASMNGVCSFFDQGFATGIYFESPAAFHGDYSATPATFGQPFISTTPRANASACYASPALACEPLTNAAECAGKVVFVDRGTCAYTLKAHNIELAGGILMAYMHNEPTPNYALDGNNDMEIHIPVITLDQAVGDRIRPTLQTAEGIASIKLTYPTYFSSATRSERSLSDFSAKGPTLDGRIKPDVLAPGEMIESAASDHDLNSFQCSRAYIAGDSNSSRKIRKPGTIAAMEGTSMAAPVAAGTAAIVRQYFTAGHYLDPVLQSADPILPSAALVKAVMISGTSAVSGTTPQQSRRALVEPPPSYHQGFGRVELSESLAYDISADRTINNLTEISKFQLFVKDQIAIQTSDVHHYCFRVRAPAAGEEAVPFKATLVWSDPPPTLPTNLFLVNNLDLMVVGYNTSTATDSRPHSVWIGNSRLLSPMSSVPAQMMFDINNNVEKIIVDQPVAGSIYSVIVRGTTVPVSSSSSIGQPYSLVVNGRFEVVQDAACPREVYCLNDCSGHGTCHLSTATASAGSSVQSTPNTGVCQCEPHYAGADCSIQAQPIIQFSNQRESTVTATVLPDQWNYYYYDVTPSDVSLHWSMQRTSTKGDPDFYWITPSMTSSAALQQQQQQHQQIPLNYPTLSYYQYVNAECDTCGKTSHDLLMYQMDLFEAGDIATPRRGGGTVMLGVWGYCCDETTVSIKLTVDRR